MPRSSPKQGYLVTLIVRVHATDNEEARAAALALAAELGAAVVMGVEREGEVKT